MIDKQFRQHIQIIHQQLAVLPSYIMQLSPAQLAQFAEVLEEIAVALGNLQLIYEEMQTSLEASAIVEEELLQQNHRFITKSHYYYDLFQLSPDAYLVIDANGVILEANIPIDLAPKPYFGARKIDNVVLIPTTQANISI